MAKLVSLVIMIFTISGVILIRSIFSISISISIFDSKPFSMKFNVRYFSFDSELVVLISRVTTNFPCLRRLSSFQILVTQLSDDFLSQVIFRRSPITSCCAKKNIKIDFTRAIYDSEIFCLAPSRYLFHTTRWSQLSSPIFCYERSSRFSLLVLLSENLNSDKEKKFRWGKWFLNENSFSAQKSGSMSSLRKQHDPLRCFHRLTINSLRKSFDQRQGGCCTKKCKKATLAIVSFLF